MQLRLLRQRVVMHDSPKGTGGCAAPPDRLHYALATSQGAAERRVAQGELRSAARVVAERGWGGGFSRALLLF
jgi:hypothetical protein